MPDRRYQKKNGGRRKKRDPERALASWKVCTVSLTTPPRNGTSRELVAERHEKTKKGGAE